MEFLVCKGEYKVQIEFKKRVTHPFRVISIQAKTAKGPRHYITEQLPGKSQNSELLRQH